MSLYGVGTSAYPAAGYGYTCKSNSRSVSGTESGSCAGTVQKPETADGIFVLHYFDNEDGERTVGATCGRDYSASVYIPKDFDPNNPVYKVKVWDKDGNVTERMVDLTTVDPENSDFIDMFAYSSYLECSGKCPGAQSAFMGSAGYSFGMDGMHYDDLFEKRSWMDNLKEMMEMQYNAGNLKGYLEYKTLWDFLENDSNVTNSVSKHNRFSSQHREISTKSASSSENANEKKLTAYYNGIPLEERTNMDKKYTDRETGISYYVADGRYPYIIGEDAEKLKKLCAETGENYVKKMAEITGSIRYLNDDTTAYIGDNGTVIKSKDGRELFLETSLLSYDVLSYMFRNLDGKGDYFNENFWSGYMRDIVGDYLTQERNE